MKTKTSLCLLILPASAGLAAWRAAAGLGPHVPLWSWRRRRRARAGFCPRCRYNLTGLTVPRCPECGAAVDLPGLVNQTVAAHED